MATGSERSFLNTKKMIIDIKVPQGWQQLDDKQLRFVFRLLNQNVGIYELQALCLFKWAKMKVIRKEGAMYIVKYRKQVFALSALKVAQVIECMGWLTDFPEKPVRLSRIRWHKPVTADFQGVPFGTFLQLDNLYQGYLLTRRNDLALEMARLLYNAKRMRHISPDEETNVIYWFTSVKQNFARIFTHFFRQAEQSEGNTAVSYQALQKAMNTQIRALTGGDITKERQVLEMDCWRALTELNAKAADQEEIERNTRKNTK